jgi:pilus assembly protein CpaE
MSSREAANTVNTRNVLVICPDRRMMAESAPLLSQSLPLTPLVEVNHYPERAALLEILETKPPGICFLDMATNRDSGFTVLRELSTMAPQLAVVVILSANDPDLILRCLRQGAAEFLLQPLSTEQLHPVLERLAQLNPARSGEAGTGARILCVMPAKGACGASTIATNLAFQLKKIGPNKVLLMDLDPATGTLSFLLKLKSHYSFMDALSRAGTLDSDLWRGMVTTVSGLDVLLSPENPVDSTTDLPDPMPVIEFCRQTYENVVIDCGCPYTPWSMSLAALCDELLLVTTNELPALRSTQRVLQTLDRHKIERSKVRLIVNRYEPDAGLNQEAIETALHIDVFHSIPGDYDAVQRALVEGKPVAANSGIGKSLVALGDRVSGKKPQTKAPTKKGSSWVSIFSSIVSKVVS